MTKKDTKISLLFETSWEVCNKIGGIYAVLSTKANTLQNLYKDKVIFIGPDVWTDEHPSPYFTEDPDTPLAEWQKNVWLPEGVHVRVGRWEIPGRPIAILVKFDGMYGVKDEFYSKMWSLYKVDSLHAYGDYDEGCAFAHAAGVVQEDIIRHFSLENSHEVICHFDEWTTGMGLLYIKHVLPAVATIFTTHATSIGRSICGNGKPLYDYLKNYNGDQMAEELNMQSKHSLEKAAAHQADCFTTVSEITAAECEQLLERRPDVVTPNGFEAGFVPKGKNFTAARAEARKELLTVAECLTGNTYDDSTFLVATSGRNEYRNKGLDVFLDAMNELAGKELPRKVIAFIMVPAWVYGPRGDLRKAIDNGTTTRLDDPVITHTLNHPEQDAILSRIHGIGFSNSADSKVTIIYVPCYLNGADGIFDKTYYDLLIGMDATVFASYYEPWGYTPLESVAFGVPTITTSLSGFGRWILDSYDNSFSACGVRVEPRTDSNYDEVKNAIATDIAALDATKKTAASKISTTAKKTAAAASWTNFIKFYEEAYKTAEENAAKRCAATEHELQPTAQ